MALSSGLRKYRRRKIEDDYLGIENIIFTIMHRLDHLSSAANSMQQSIAFMKGMRTVVDTWKNATVSVDIRSANNVGKAQFTLSTDAIKDGEFTQAKRKAMIDNILAMCIEYQRLHMADNHLFITKHLKDKPDDI